MKIKSYSYSFILLLFLIQQLSAQTNERIRISQDLELIRLTENVYMHVSYATLPGYGRSSANGVIFINDKKAFLFDTPWNDSLTSQLVSYVEDRMKLKIEGFIPNHWHEDCMGGLSCLKEKGIKSYANQLTIDIAKKKNLPPADQGFRDSVMINLGNKTIFCYYFGPAHSMDNVVVWIPSDKILFPGCMCKSMDSRNLGNTADGDISEYNRTIDRVIQKFSDSMIVIPGHGAPGGKELLLHTKTLIP